MSATESDRTEPKLTLWLDPVCPFSWNTARWLHAVAEKAGWAIDWRLMSLAVLNEGRELPPPSGPDARLTTDRPVDDGHHPRSRHYWMGGRVLRLRAAVLRPFGTPRCRPRRARLDCGRRARRPRRGGLGRVLDELVRQEHQAGQDALGETGGSPILRIGEHAFFGPVLTAPPDADAAGALFDAVATLAATPQFAQLQRPRTAA